MELTVTVSTHELTDAVQRNKDRHRQIFEEALEGFRNQVVTQLERRIAEVKKGKIPDLYIRLPIPEDHTDDYSRVLKMLEMHQDEELRISQDDFASYVMDDWGWKKAFIASASNYTSNAV